MQTQTTLPECYAELFKLNLQKDKKLAILVNCIALLIMAAMFVTGALIVPLKAALPALETADTVYVPLIQLMLKLIVTLFGCILYIVLHELVHGIFMKHFSGVKPSYGFTGLYAYAGSSAYFDKKSYVIITLAPIVIWGIALMILTILAPREWFWVVYFIQITNISGAAGDLYITFRFRKLPNDILINDTGIEMRVYGNKKMS